MNLRLHSNLLAVFVICLFSVAPYSHAQTTHTWTNALGGIFSDNANWDIGAPGPNGLALFNRAATYGVALNADAQIGSIYQAGGEVAFVGGRLLKLTQAGAFRGGITRILDPGTELQAETIVVGGSVVTPILQAESFGTIIADEDFNIAVNDMWSGTAKAIGNGSQINVGANLNVGFGGTGRMNIENGGSVNAPLTSIGRNATGIGELTVADEGSGLNTDSLLVGVHPMGDLPGVGTLNLQAGGDVFVGGNSPATNTGSNLYVSNPGTASTMQVGNGSTVNNDGGVYIGLDSGSSGEVTIDDAAWFNGDVVRVGFVGTGTFNIQNGAAVILPSNKSVLIATNSPATGIVNVDGDGSTLVAGSIWACTRGNGTLNVTNGGDVNNASGNGYIAGLGGVGTANVNGNGSRWFNLNLYLGGTANAIGGVGILNVENQGNVYVGNNTPSIPGALVVGDSGSNGNLVVKNGSTINCRDAYIGHGSVYSGIVDISGSGSQWNVVGDLTVGLNGTGSLRISDNAMVAAQETHVNDVSEIVIDGGQLDTGINLSNSGLLHFTGGMSQVMGAVSNNAGGDIVVDSMATAVFHDKVGHTGNPILVDGEVYFMDAYYGENAFTGSGDVYFDGILRPYNFATGQIFFAGGLNVLMDSHAQTEIDIAGTGDFDRMTVSGDLKIDGTIAVNWLGGFQPSLGEEYLIANVTGDNTGQFIGIGEGEMVAQAGNIGLFISYTAGDGNDVALFTDLVPDVVVPAEFNVIRGTYVSGGLTELATSDNADVSIRRSASDIQSRTEFEVASFATSANPSFMSITLEGSVFARSNVVQTIHAYNFDTAQFELVDTRNASRFNDNSTTVELLGNLSRFVEDGTHVVVARVRYQSDNPRQQFSSNTDLFTWGFAD
jgi:T5SS/PEP-CTERM-associated repeat protein